VLSNLFRPEKRAISYQSLFQSGAPMSTTTKSGVSISEDNSLTINTVYAAVRLISDTISTLPMDTFIRRQGERYPYRPRPAWVDNPEPDVSVQRSDHFQSLLVSLLVDGNSFTRILRRPDSTDVVALTVLDPRRVTVRRNSSGVIEFAIDNGAYVLTESEVIHITELRRPGALRGTSRINELRETFGLSKALDDWASTFFSNGSSALGVIEVPQEISADQASALQSAWEKGHQGLRRSHRPGILSGGATWKQTSVDPDDSQLLSSREFSVEEVCRAFRIPPHLLQSTRPGAMAYASVEANSQQFTQYTLLPYVKKIEDAYSRYLLPTDVFLRMNMDGLLRPSLADRYTAYSQGIQAGFLSLNDIRRTEDMPRVDGGDVYRVSLANIDLAASELVEMDKRVDMATRLINVGFSPDDALKALGLPTIIHTGLPSVQLQNAAQQSEIEDDEDKDEVYPTGRTVRRTVERDAHGFITAITEESE
jgi:HK97 family phage portal protein